MNKHEEDRAGRHVRRVSREEERLWSEFYRAVGNPTVAAELIAHLDQDAEARQLHSALYLRCRQSLRRAKQRKDRARAVAKALRAILNGLFVWPFMLAKSGGRFCVDVSVAILAKRNEPAAGQMRKIGKRPARAPQTPPVEATDRACGSDGR